MSAMSIRLCSSVLGLSFALAAAFTASAQEQANPFFDDTQIQQINLTVGSADWGSLLQNYTADTYYPATFTWNGVIKEVGIRQHGDASRSPIKPNLDINFGYYAGKQTFLGLPFILLKANNEDPTNLHEWISMKLFRQMGFPAPREAPAQLSINGQYFGFYMIVEHLDSSFLQRNLGESSGYLYEWQYDNAYNLQNLGTDPSLYAPFIKLKSNQAAPDLQTFANFVQVVNQPVSSTFTNDNFIAALSQYIDPKSFLTYAATENVLAEADALVGGIVGMNNFFFYQYDGTTFYQLIPWDKDLTFWSPIRDVMNGFTMGPTINVLAQRLIGIPEYQNFYLGQVSKAATLFGDANGWAARQINFEYNLIDSAASNDPLKQCLGSGGVLYSCGTADFQNGMQTVFTFLQQRSDFEQGEVQVYGYQPPQNDPQIQSASMTAPSGLQIAMAAITPPASEAAPGAFVTISGVNLGSDGVASSATLPRSLANSYVAVEGVRAPLVATSAGQIEFQMPGDLPAGTANVVVSVAGEMSNTFVLQVQAAIPGILAIAHQSDGSAVTVANPAQAGEIVIVYAAGLGSVTGALPFGQPAPQAPLFSTAIAPQVTLGNAPATVIFSGLSPGSLGLYQVMILMPDVLPAGGSATLTLLAGPPSLAASTTVPVASQ